MSYEEILGQLKQGKGLAKEVEELIRLDVHRSFQALHVIKPASLVSVLRCCAVEIKDVEYCQGMNFLAGFFLLLAGEEAQAFNMMQRTMRRYKMIGLFTQDVPLLRKCFYLLDRLIHAHYPEVSHCFRKEGISSNYFSSTWFMTVFTNSLQYIKDGDTIPPLLLAIWDAFIADGWKAIFKAALFIIGALEDKLVDARFDVIMLTLGELPRGTFMSDPGNAARFRESYPKLKITNRLLGGLVGEYVSIYNQLDEPVESGLGQTAGSARKMSQGLH